MFMERKIALLSLSLNIKNKMLNSEEEICTENALSSVLQLLDLILLAMNDNVNL